uniref:Uncharacterized protein n=1 Tax=Trichogramma kaykai TaxID=54128 RepID=A0ABD2WTI1_9HYME
MDANKVIQMVRAALSELGLQTTDHRTEVLLVTSRKLQENREKIQRSQDYVGSLQSDTLEYTSTQNYDSINT